MVGLKCSGEVKDGGGLYSLGSRVECYLLALRSSVKASATTELNHVVFELSWV